MIPPARSLFTLDFLFFLYFPLILPLFARFHGLAVAGPNHGPIEGEVEIVPKAGTVVILHTRCFHRVSHFTGARPRIVINSRCSPAGARADVTRFPVFRSQTWDHQTGLPWAEDDLRGGDATS